MTTLATEANRSSPSNILLLLGLATSLPSIAMGSSIPDFIRDATLMLIAVGVIWCVVTPGGREQNRSLMFWPILLVLLGVLPSLFNSTDLQASQETLGFLPIGFVLFIGICIADGAGRTIIAIAATTSILLIALEVTIQHLSSNGSVADTPHPIHIMILPMLLPIAVIGIETLPRKLALLVGPLLVPLVVFSVITSWSPGAWAGLIIVGIGLSIWRGGVVRASIGCGFILAMLLVAIDVADAQDRLLSLADPMSDERIGLWLAAMAMFLEHPFTGIGAGVFGIAYPDVVSMIQLPDGYEAGSGFIPWAHNMYLELLAEYGLPGFLAYAIITAWLLGKLVAQIVLGQGRGRGDDPDDPRHWAVALLISWLAILTMAMLDLSFHRHWVVYIYWLMVGLSFSIVLHRSQTSPARGTPQSPTIP